MFNQCVEGHLAAGSGSGDELASSICGYVSWKKGRMLVGLGYFRWCCCGRRREDAPPSLCLVSRDNRVRPSSVCSHLSFYNHSVDHKHYLNLKQAFEATCATKREEVANESQGQPCSHKLMKRSRTIGAFLCPQTVLICFYENCQSSNEGQFYTPFTPEQTGRRKLLADQTNQPPAFSRPTPSSLYSFLLLCVHKQHYA